MITKHLIAPNQSREHWWELLSGSYCMTHPEFFIHTMFQSQTHQPSQFLPPPEAEGPKRVQQV